jgi:hypothetical protein
MNQKKTPPSAGVWQGGESMVDVSNIPRTPENGKSIDREAAIERASIIEYDARLSRYYSELRAAELYGLTTEQREAIFPLPRRTGFEAILFMAERGFQFLATAADGVPIAKWKDRKNFTNAPERLRAWHGQGFRRFMYLPAMAKYIGLDIDVNHRDGKDGLHGFYNVLECLAGKTADRLPSFLRDMPHNLPCYTKTPRSGLHILFKYSGACKVSNLTHGDSNLEVKYSASGLSLGEKTEGAYVLHGDPADAPDLPLFLAALINPQPKPSPQPRYRPGTKPGLENIMLKIQEKNGDRHNQNQKDFAWRAAYFDYGLEEVLDFVKNHPDVFGNDPDTAVVVRHAWRANTARVTA